MLRVHFIHPDGRRETHPAVDGDTVVDCALDNGVEGIIAQCGGGCTCTTCHCYVPSKWFSRLPPMDPDELELIDYVEERQHNSKLACQIVMTPDLDGIEIQLPDGQSHQAAGRGRASDDANGDRSDP